MKPKGYFIIFLAIIALILMFQNIQTVQVDFFFWDWDMPLIVLIAFCVVLGFLGGYFISVLKKSTKE